MLLLLLLLPLFSSSKLNSSLPLLSMTSSSSNVEAHKVKLIPRWHPRTELHWQNDMMGWWYTTKNISDGNFYFVHYVFLYFGWSCPTENAVSVCDPTLYTDKNSSWKTLTFFFMITGSDGITNQRLITLIFTFYAYWTFTGSLGLLCHLVSPNNRVILQSTHFYLYST